MEHLYKIPLILAPQPEGGYTVTSPLFPELISEADTLDELVPNVQDAVRAVIEIYEDLGKSLPQNLAQDSIPKSTAEDPIMARPVEPVHASMPGADRQAFVMHSGGICADALLEEERAR